MYGGQDEQQLHGGQPQGHLDSRVFLKCLYLFTFTLLETKKSSFGWAFNFILNSYWVQGHFREGCGVGP